jgi:hypothetical protein
MATRPIIESGNVQARQVGNVPMQQISQQQTNYMVAANVQAQEAGTLAQILNDMRATVLEFSGKRRMEEGLRYVAENPATKEQLDLAAGGITSPTLGGGIGKFSGDLPSFFNQAVRKARSAELSSHFLIEGKAILSSILTDIQNGTPNVTPESIKTKINSATTGFSKTLSAVDPEAAIQFQASMAAHGNTVLNAAYESQLKKNQEERKIKFDSGFDNDRRLLEEDIKAGDKVPFDNIGPAITIDDRINSQRQSITTAALAFGGLAMQKEYSEKFDIAVRNAKINVLTNYLTSDEFMVDPLVTLSKIRAGDAGKMSSLLKQMITSDFESVAKVTSNYMIAVNQREEFSRRKRDEEKRNGEATAINLLEQIYPIKDVKNPTRIALVQKLMDLPPGSLPIGTIKDLLEPEKEGEGNPLAEYNALKMIFDNKITTTDQLDKIPGLNARQRLSLLKALRTENKEGLRTLDTGLNKLAGFPTEPGGLFVIDKKSEEFKRKQELKVRAAEIERDANIEGKVLTESQIIDKMEKEILEKRNSVAAKQAKESLDNFVVDKSGKPKLDRDWITGPINRQTLPILRQKAEATKNLGDRAKRIRQVNEAERLIEVSEGK